MRFTDGGDLKDASTSEHLDSLIRNKSTSLPFWEDDAVSAYVSVDPIGDNMVREFILTSVLSQETEMKICTAMILRFRKLSGDRMIVVDLLGDSPEFVNWDSFFMDHLALLRSDFPSVSLPTVLGMMSSRFALSAGVFQGFCIERTNECTIASRFSSLDEFYSWQSARYLKLGTWTRIEPADQK